MARDEEMLVSQAATMGFEDFHRALGYWKQLADSEGADAADEDRRAARTCTSSRASRGCGSAR